MIDVDAARLLVSENIKALPSQHLLLEEAFGKILAVDIRSDVDVPQFAQSAMDGYAFSFDAWKQAERLKIVGEIPAGAGDEKIIRENEAVRIFTGAPVPAGADTVVMQERTSVNRQILSVDDDRLSCGSNIRPAGSEVKKGELALEKGTPLTAGAVGFLASMGISSVEVVPNPLVSIIITGDELQVPGQQLGYGQVYECNSYTLTAALQSAGIVPAQVFKVKDDPLKLEAAVSSALDRSDIVLLTGGVSVGEYDFVTKAAAQCGVTTIFHKIAQRPGKPLFFGKKNEKVVFGLPGNPSSVLTCFYMYVLPALQALSQRALALKSLLVPLQSDYTKQHALSHFLKGRYDGVAVSLLGAQESYRLSSFANANCMVELGKDARLYQQGEEVVIHLL